MLQWITREPPDDEYTSDMVKLFYGDSEAKDRPRGVLTSSKLRPDRSGGYFIPGPRPDWLIELRRETELSNRLAVELALISLGNR